MASILHIRALPGLFGLACLLLAGMASADIAHAARKPHTDTARPLAVAADIAIDPAIAGHWLPYSTDAYFQLGPLDLQPGTLRFAKGQNFTFIRSAEVLRLTPEKKANERGIKALCKGNDMARSVVIGLHQKDGQTLLQLAFYAGSNGPGAAVGQAGGAKACQTISYTRAQPLVL
jgi:hypothetical protein